MYSLNRNTKIDGGYGDIHVLCQRETSQKGGCSIRPSLLPIIV